MDARLLDKRLLRGPAGGSFQVPSFEMPQPAPPPLDDPEAYQVQPGPVGARALAIGGPGPMPAAPAPAPAATIAQPDAAKPPATGSQWTPERKAFAKKINETARRYKQAVEGRRAQRQALSQYSKLKHQLEGAAGTLQDLNNMETTYPDIYSPDSPALMALQKSKIGHFEKVQRLRQQLNQMAQQLNKQYGMPIGKHGGLEDEDRIASQGDDQFDEEIRQGYIDAIVTQPPGY